MFIDRERLTLMLMRKSWTQKELARRAGLSRATVNGIKAGRRCSEETAGKIARALNVDLTKLLVDDPERR